MLTRKSQLLIILIIIITMFTMPVFSEESTRFSFRNGISFGMSEEELIQTEEKQNQVDKTSWHSGVVNNWRVIMTLDTKVKVSSYEALISYYLADNKMEVAAYGFFNNVNETMYDTISKAVTAVYGEGKPVTAKEIMTRMDCIVTDESIESEISHGFIWELENVVIYQYYLGDDSFILLYTNPNFDYESTKRHIDTIGI